MEATGAMMARRGKLLVLAVFVVVVGFAAGSLLMRSGDAAAAPAKATQKGKPIHTEGIVTASDRRGITIAPVQTGGRAAPSPLTFAFAAETTVVGYKVGPDPRVRATPRVGDRLQIDGWYSPDGRMLTARSVVRLPDRPSGGTPSPSVRPSPSSQPPPPRP